MIHRQGPSHPTFQRPQQHAEQAAVPKATRVLREIALNHAGPSPVAQGPQAPKQPLYLPSKTNSAAARAAHPLPAALVNQYPFLAPARTLVRRKSQSTLQASAECAVAEPVVFTKDSDAKRKAREAWRLKLSCAPPKGRKMPTDPMDAKMRAFVVAQDEALLRACEAVVTAGTLPVPQREEAEHMASHGLTENIRCRARAVAQKHNPFLRILWRKVDNPAAQARGDAHAPAQTFAHLPTNRAQVRLIRAGSRPGSAAQGLVRPPAVAALTSDTGKTYLVAEPSSHGAFKRFSVGVTDSGEAVAVLMMRGRGGRDVFGDTQSAALPAQLIDTEIKNLTAFSDDFEIYDAFDVNGIYFLIMPLFDAGDLQQAFESLDERKRYAAGVQLLPDMLEQIIKLHERHHALHSDVKMPNFLATSSGRVVLGDFGLSERLNAAGAVNVKDQGTLLAPEQLAQQRVNQAIDFWSLGASLGDLFVPDFVVDGQWVLNPHYLSGGRDTSATANEASLSQHFRADVEATRRKQQLFGEFRAFMFKDEATGFNLDWLHVTAPKPGGQPELVNMLLYYQRFVRQAPALAQFCLEHLLEPNPGLRSTQRAKELLEMAKMMREAAMGASGQPLTLPQDPKIAAALASLRAIQSEALTQAA